MEVPEEALRDFIEYAADLRFSVDNEFCVSTEERDASEREFDDHIRAMGLK